MHLRQHKKLLAVCGLMLITCLIAIFGFVYQAEDTRTTSKLASSNPLAGKIFYRDDNRTITKLTVSYREAGNQAEAELLSKISTQPGTTWLNGPNEGDTAAKEDIDTVIRTSKDAASTMTTPVYQLYAIPHRDACAPYSSGGFKTKEQYLNWIQTILMNLRTPSIFIVEADALAHTLQPGCLTKQQISERYDILKSAIQSLSKSKNVVGIYIDAAHSEWFPDPTVLVGPLRKSGIDDATGIAVNVSNFIDTASSTEWAGKLLGNFTGKGAVIDTSRNGKGSPHTGLRGEDRWCNPKGVAIGRKPSTKTDAKHIHAYIWVKKAGESDGACNGYPSAGSFVPELAFDLVNNTQ